MLEFCSLVPCLFKIKLKDSLVITRAGVLCFVPLDLFIRNLLVKTRALVLSFSVHFYYEEKVPVKA